MRRILLLALLTLPLPALAQTAPTQLQVQAEARVQGAPDIATISAGVVTNAGSAAAAMAENATKMTAVFAALKQAGIAERNIQTSGINVQPQYDYTDGQAPKLSGYQVSNTVSVQSEKLDQLGSVLDALVGVGANQINGPTFAIKNPEPLLDQARKQAVATANARAALYASAAGLKVGRIVSLSEGGTMPDPRPMPMMMRAMAAEAAPTPVAAGQLDLSVSLNVVYELVP